MAKSGRTPRSLVYRSHLTYFIRMIGLSSQTDVIVNVKDLKEQTPKHIQSFFRGRDPVLCVILAHDKKMGLVCSRMSFPNVDKFQVFLISFDIGLPLST